MKIFWIGGNHPRHLYYLNTINKAFPITAGIMERREEMVPLSPDNLQEIDRNNFILHFQNRVIAEHKYFGSPSTPDFKILEVRENNLNSEKSAKFVKQISPDVVLIFGCGLVKDPLFSALPHNTINLHLGLSPTYRGSATLFWPFYFMEPTYAGTTFHYIVSEPDAGDIVHQVVPELNVNDKIHDVACKSIVQSAKDATILIDIFKSERKWKRYQQKGSGKNFLSSDFKPEHLRVNYNIFNDDMVKQCLEGRLSSRKPALVRQL